MKLISTLIASTLASIAIAQTDFVTRYHYITVDSNGITIGSDVFLSQATDAQDLTPSTTLDSYNSQQAATTLATIRTSAPSFVNFESDASSSADGPVIAATSQTISQYSPIASNPTSPQDITQVVSASNPTTPKSSIVNSASPTESDGGIYSEISSSGVDANFAKTILDAHNTKREAHSASALSWSASLFQYAQNYANSYTCGSSLVHSGGSYGENLADGYSSGVAALNAWYAEGDNYNYNAANVFDHFTQVIWKSTTKLGCAYKSCNGGLYVICSYDPAGNYVGEGSDNLSAN